ncbi:hypothetical protein [Flavobacterium marginilacus]|uniref:hypothetical protein n=1 Tax=Flavobacterium marginilacus TaxID=3003256 RepID=UPI00248DDD50|nr:hypothetical protein [Flavobacterium marginilacus]
MKKSVLLSGIALVLFSNICNAENRVNKSSSLFQNIILSDNDIEKQNDDTQLTKPSLKDEGEVFNPETVIAFNRKTVKEIIAEGDKITENSNTEETEFLALEASMKEIIAQSDLIIESKVSDVRCPLFVERTMEDEIAELELIIESKENNEVRDLDFKKINRIPVLINSFNSKKIIGMN